MARVLVVFQRLRRQMRGGIAIVRRQINLSRSLEEVNVVARVLRITFFSPE
jgi:hypothetical protein